MNRRQRHFRVLSPTLISLVGEQFYRLNRPLNYTGRSVFKSLEKILVLRLDKIGDVVMTSAFLRELRGNHPSAHITLVVNSTTFNLVSNCPYVDEVLVFPWKSYSRDNQWYRHWRTWQFAREHLQPQKFDLVIVPRYDVDFYLENYMAYYSGAPLKLAYTEKSTSSKQHLNYGEDKLFTHLLPDTSLSHEVAHSLNIIRFMGGSVTDHRLEIWPAKEDENTVEGFLRSHHILKEMPLFCFGIGAGDPKRIWPVERYAQVCQWIHDNYQGRIILIGAPEEKILGEQLSGKFPNAVINATGRFSLRQTGALLKRSALFIGNDSGPMHLAAAAGTPVIEISPHPLDGDKSHFNSPLRFGPWKVHSMVIQPSSAISPCTDSCDAEEPHCITQITPRDVQTAIRTINHSSLKESI